MPLTVEIIDNPNDEVTDKDIRSLVMATLARAMFCGLDLPKTVKIFCVPEIVRDGRQYTGLLKANFDGYHEIEIVFGARPRNEVLNSVLHELTHLLRIINKTFSSDSNQEEIGNLADMRKSWPIISDLMAIMINQECYETTIQDRISGPVVREGSVTARV